MSTRLVFLVMMISSVVIFENYSASFTAFLSVVKLSLPFDSLDDLYTGTSFRLGSLAGGSFKDIILGVILKQVIH